MPCLTIVNYSFLSVFYTAENVIFDKKINALVSKLFFYQFYLKGTPNKGHRYLTHIPTVYRIYNLIIYREQIGNGL